MSELIHEFSRTVASEEGVGYLARIRGEVDESGHWDGWIEFVPQDGGPVRQTPRETTQSNREHLEYWASGLSEDFLQMALRRARTLEGEPVPPPPLEEPGYDPEGIRESSGSAPAVRLELETLDPLLPRKLMRLEELREGQVRRIRGGGIIVYDGLDAPEGGPSRHRFLIQFGSGNEAAVLANHIWTALHDAGSPKVLVEGQPVEIQNHALAEALRQWL